MSDLSALKVMFFRTMVVYTVNAYIANCLAFGVQACFPCIISPLRSMPTFYERFQQSARQFPSKIALEIQRQDRIESVTFAELQTMAESAGSWLAGKVDRDARVAILAANHPRWVAAYLGIICAGRVAVPLDTAFHADQVAKLLQDSGASGLFCDAKHLAMAQEAAGGLPVGLVMTSAAGERVAATAGSGAGAKPIADLDSIFAAGSGGFNPVVPS